MHNNNNLAELLYTGRLYETIIRVLISMVMDAHFFSVCVLLVISPSIRIPFDRIKPSLDTAVRLLDIFLALCHNLFSWCFVFIDSEFVVLWPSFCFNYE